MKTSTFTFKLDESNTSINIPFDELNAGNYNLRVIEDRGNNDIAVLTLDRDACQSFASIFLQLAFGDYGADYHVHLGLDQNDPAGPGIRIVLS